MNSTLKALNDAVKKAKSKIDFLKDEINGVFAGTKDLEDTIKKIDVIIEKHKNEDKTSYVVQHDFIYSSNKTVEVAGRDKINYIVMVDLNGTKEEWEFDFSIEAIEEDGVDILLENAIEGHIQDFYCCCTFSEAQNHCDCNNDYDGYEITKREVVKDDQ